MKPEDLPYSIQGYPERYDETYIENPRTIAHAEFELSLIEKHHSKDEILSWCDTGCGTGWHIRNSTIKKPKIGIDREQNMLNHAEKLMPLGAEWLCYDINDIYSTLGTFDLVTHFWYGYIHQKTLDDVNKTLLSLVKSTSLNGVLILSICDPVEWSKKINYQNNIVFDNELFIDSIIWRYKNPFTQTDYANCIAPHPILIEQWLAPYFEKIEKILYPKSSGSQEWQKYAYICSNRNEEEVTFNGD